MKICLVGLGSMGQRHLRNIVSLSRFAKCPPQIDALRNKGAPLAESVRALLTNEYHCVEELPCDYDAIFVCNPTGLHFKTLTELAGKAFGFFVEKPVFDSLQLDISALVANGAMYYVACPLRYTNVVQYLKQYVATTHVFAARAICSTYLPDWRPNTDYRTCYSAKKELGGGVSIDLIHEWDYLYYLFGVPLAVQSVIGTFSPLEITSDDTALYLAQYADKAISLHLDYFGRYARREIELYTENEVVVGDLTHSEIRLLRSGEVILLKEQRDSYQQRELDYFFDILAGNAPNTNSMEFAMQVLQTAKGEHI